MPPTKTADDTVWVKNLATGHTHGMSAESAAYYLNQRDPITGAIGYEKASAPKAAADDFDEKEFKRRQAQAKAQAATVQVPVRAQGDPSVRDSTAPYQGHGVPDAARMEVAAGASEMGPTIRAESDRKAVTGGEAPMARQGEAAMAAEQGQEAAELQARLEAAERALKAKDEKIAKLEKAQVKTPTTPAEGSKQDTGKGKGKGGK